MISLRKPNKLQFAFFVGLLISCTSNAPTPARSISDIQSCETFLKSNSAIWIEDRLGEKGHREQIVDTLMQICNLHNKRWSVISSLFGAPFSKAVYDDSIISYKFRINYFKDGEHSVTGNRFLMVEVINDTITLFRILEIDG